MICVFDASALTAVLTDEPGADVVRGLLTTPGNSFFAHAMNLCEVFYGFRRSAGEAAAQAALNTLSGLQIGCREDLDLGFWQDAGRIKADYRRVSLADCLCIAL